MGLLDFWDWATADRAYDIEKIMIGSGKVYGAFHPITADTTLGELGLYNRDGMIFRPDYSAREVMADQFPSVLRTFVHTKKMEMQFKLMELTGYNQTWAFLNPNYDIDSTTGEITSLAITGDYAEPYMMMVFVTPFKWQAQNYIREVLIPKAALKSVGEITYKAEEEGTLDLTLGLNLDFDMSGYEEKGLLFGVRDHLQTP